MTLRLSAIGDKTVLNVFLAADHRIVDQLMTCSCSSSLVAYEDFIVSQWVSRTTPFTEGKSVNSRKLINIIIVSSPKERATRIVWKSNNSGIVHKFSNHMNFEANTFNYHESDNHIISIMSRVEPYQIISYCPMIWAPWNWLCTLALIPLPAFFWQGHSNADANKWSSPPWGMLRPACWCVVRGFHFSLF